MPSSAALNYPTPMMRMYCRSCARTLPSHRHTQSQGLPGTDTRRFRRRGDLTGRIPAESARSGTPSGIGLPSRAGGSGERPLVVSRGSTRERRPRRGAELRRRSVAVALACTTTTTHRRCSLTPSTVAVGTIGRRKPGRADPSRPDPAHSIRPYFTATNTDPSPNVATPLFTLTGTSNTTTPCACCPDPSVTSGICGLASYVTVAWS